MAFEFFSSCTGWPIAVQHLNNAINDARDISRRTFLKYVNPEQMQRIERELNYERDARHGLTMANDWHVSYHKTKLLGCPAVYFVWSAIEFVFTDLRCLDSALREERRNPGIS